MESQIESPIPLSQLAKMSFVSLRQLERLFHQFLDCSPSHYYLKLRLSRARLLLCESSLSAAEIAVASGFNSTSHFGRAYRKHFGITPGAQRQLT
jgi:transcriptional regulator GlxA family with amidase domain